MLKLSDYKKEELYKNIMGSGDKSEQSITPTETDIKPTSDIKSADKKNNLDELVHKSYYITKRHVKALKIRMAMSDEPEDKDYSAIVRTALDLYLADDLKNI